MRGLPRPGATSTRQSGCWPAIRPIATRPLTIAHQKQRQNQGRTLRLSTHEENTESQKAPFVITFGLFLNGVYESSLIEILEAQAKQPDLVCMLQPYSGQKIKLLAEAEPTPEAPIVLYLSVTTSLGQISYRARIVGWHDKRTLQQNELADLNRQILAHQPTEKEVYLTVGGKPCVNLIFVSELEKLTSPIPVSCFVKIGNHLPLKPRSRSGGFAYVEPQPDWLGTVESQVESDATRSLQAAIRKSITDSPSDRALRLANAPRKPEQIQVIARAFKRNPDVIAEVLNRAAGKCERCLSPAPFLRASDGSPFLEVHHRHSLAGGGDDTVGNALALCPNCHREHHYGTLE